MKRSKKLWLLLALLAVICAATFLVTRIEEQKEQIKNSGEIILDISDYESVLSLSWETEEVSLSFHNDGVWTYDDDPAFPVDGKKMEDLLSVFRSFGAAFIIEEVVDFSQYGLDEPVCTINLTTTEQSYEITLGAFSTMDSQRYVSIGDGNVYLVSKDPMDSFDAVLDDVIDHDETPNFEEVSKLQFSGAENYHVFYEDNGSSYREEDVYYAQLGSEVLPVDPELTEDYLDTISSLNLSDYATYNVTDEELASYGLDSPELTVTVQYTTEDENGEALDDSFTLSISRSAELKAADVEKGEDTEESEEEEEITFAAYVRVGESQIVYRLLESNYNALMAASYDSLRHPEVFPAEVEKIRQIDVLLEDTNYTFTAELVDEKRVYSYLEEELETIGLPNALKKLSADSFTSEAPTLKQEIALTVHLDLEGDPTVLIELYRYDGTNCLAVVDGEPVSLVPRSSVVDLMESVFAIVLNP